MLRFCASAFCAYTLNLSVIALGRHMGFIDNPIVQALAIATYSATFFLLSLNVVFTRRPERS
jgi:hypothetical protein